MKISKDAKTETRWYACEGFDLRNDGQLSVDLQEVQVVVRKKTIRVVRRVRGLSPRQWPTGEYCPLSTSPKQALERLREDFERETESAKHRAADLLELQAKLTEKLNALA